MKKLFTIVALFVLFVSGVHAQQLDTLQLKVVSFKELQDCYIISALGQSKPDTLYIISAKDNLDPKIHYQEISVGKIYYFVCSNPIANLAAMPPDKFTLRIKHTIVWKGTDNIKKLPLFALNAQGLFINEINNN